MRRGFFLPKHTQKRSGVTQPAATSMHLSTEASELAGIVLSRHASYLAILLRDSSVLYLCRSQTRKEARVHQFSDILDLTYMWTKPLAIAMSQGQLPLDGAPPSAFTLGQFPHKVELCSDEDDATGTVATYHAKITERALNLTRWGSDPLFARRWNDMLDCLIPGLKAFQDEALDGVEVDEEWLNYYHSNINTVNNCIKVMNPFCGTSQQAFKDEQCR